MGKFFKWVFILGVLTVGGWYAWKWYRGPAISSDAFGLIPSNAIYCIATSDPIKSWKDISGSLVWSHMQRNTYFASLTSSANSLDSLIHENDLLFDLIGSHALIASAHMTGPKDYDFLFLVDLEEVSGIKFLNNYLTEFTAAGYRIHREKYKDESLISLYNPADSSTLHLSMPGSFLLASYTKKIVTAAIDSRDGNNSLATATFNTAEHSIEDNGIVRLYVNYAMLPKFMKIYSNENNEYVARLSQALHTSSLSLSITDNLVSAKGYTYINDSIESYIKTLAVSGKSGTDITSVAPTRTASYLGFGFTSFQEFFKNFEKNIQQDVAQYNSYKANMKQVENFLNIDLERNFISWIGDEVALFELQSSGKGLDNEVALVFKAHDIESARKNLAYIEKMVRKRTPVKFRKVDHRGYSIDYLSMKGVFRVLFGKFFDRYDKPYFTVLNNFVIFSNHPQTLESIIDDYLDKKTLAYSEDFRSFKKEFDDESSVFIYLNTPVLFNSLKKLADVPTRKSMEKNKPFIVCFKQIGFQLMPESRRFKTLMAERFDTPQMPTTVLAQVPAHIDNPEEDSVDVELVAPSEVDETDNKDPMALPYIYVQNLNAKEYSGYYPDSTVMYTVELKNGFKNGDFIQFHKNGGVKLKGSFKNDMREGVWKLYDETGKLIMKRRYDDDAVKREKIK